MVDNIYLKKIRDVDCLSKRCAMIEDLVVHSFGKDKIAMSPAMWDIQTELRIFMFQRVYLTSEAKTEEIKARRLIADLFTYFMENPAEIEQAWGANYQADQHMQHVIDYIAGMTDNYAIRTYERVFVPKNWTIFGRTS